MAASGSSHKGHKGGWEQGWFVLAGAAGLGGVDHFSCLMATQNCSSHLTTQGNCLAAVDIEAQPEAQCTLGCAVQGKQHAAVCGTKLPMCTNTATTKPCTAVAIRHSAWARTLQTQDCVDAI